MEYSVLMSEYILRKGSLGSRRVIYHPPSKYVGWLHCEKQQDNPQNFLKFRFLCHPQSYRSKELSHTYFNFDFLVTKGAKQIVIFFFLSESLTTSKVMVYNLLCVPGFFHLARPTLDVRWIECDWDQCQALPSAEDSGVPERNPVLKIFTSRKQLYPAGVC